MRAIRNSLLLISLLAIAYVAVTELHLIDEIRCRMDGRAGSASGAAAWTKHIIDNSGNGADGVHVADFDGDGFADVVSGWEQSGEIKMYLNPGKALASDSPWRNLAISGGLAVKGIEDAAFADLDLDGRVDSVLSAVEGSGKSLGIHWPPGQHNHSDQWQGTALVPAQKSAYMKARAGQIDSQHGADIVAGTKDDGGEGAALYWFRGPADSGPDTAGQWQRFFVGSVDGKTTTLELRDMNGDGLLDAVYAGRSGIGWFRNPGEDLEQAWQRVIVSEQDSEFTFCDIDRDGLEDIVAGSSRYSDRVARWYRRQDASAQRWQAHDISTAEGRPGKNTGVKFVIKGVACLPRESASWPELVFTGSGYGHGLFKLTPTTSPSTDNPWQQNNLSEYQCGMKFDNVELVDVDRDGDLDAVTTEEGEGVLTAGDGVVWFENPAVP